MNVLVVFCDIGNSLRAKLKAHGDYKRFETSWLKCSGEGCEFAWKFMAGNLAEAIRYDRKRCFEAVRLVSQAANPHPLPLIQRKGNKRSEFAWQWENGLVNLAYRSGTHFLQHQWGMTSSDLRWMRSYAHNAVPEILEEILMRPVGYLRISVIYLLRVRSVR